MNIIVTGGTGLVGKSLKEFLPNAFYLSSKNYDLTNEKSVILMFNTLKPDIIIHLAAKVGGITDNIKYPAEYLTENILMNTLLVKYSYIFNVKKLVAVLSSCIYPSVVKKYPMPETVLHDGAPPLTNFAYAYAKRSLAVQIDSYNSQYNTNYNYLIPCNLYGEHDKYGENSHYVPALIKKIIIAKKNNRNSITLFGDGTPLRQFMHVSDLAYIIAQYIKTDIQVNLNVASNEHYTINEIAKIALKSCNAEHLNILYDATVSNGQIRKDIDTTKLIKTFPHYNFISLKEGIKNTYNKVYNDICEE